jgi:hypothetical protein
MKKVLFGLIFILVIGFLNYSTAIQANGFCENCNQPRVGAFKPVEGGAYHGLYCNICNRLMVLDIAQGLKMEPHQYNNAGVCIKCNFSVNNCNHEGTTRRYRPNSDRTTHKVICENCNTVIQEAEACYPDQSTCHKCSVKKKATFDIPTRVYYIDETGLKSVDSLDTNTNVKIFIENNVGTPYFSWTMSTTGANQYNSYSNNSYGSAASDGTIRFWYTGNGFDAMLESAPKNLSGEVLIKITMKVDDVEISQNIRIIKNGSPESNCTIYLKNSNIALTDEILGLMIRTNYVDFSDEDIRKLRLESPETLPLYTVKDQRIEELRSFDESILKISSYEIKEVTDETINGYMAMIKIRPQKKGRTKIKYKLITEYSYKNHETIEKEREGTLIVNVLEKAPSEGSEYHGGSGDSSGGYGGSSEDPDGGGEGESGRRGSSSAGLAFVGVMGLLIVAIIGSKMMNHR